MRKGVRGAALRAEHERCALAYAAWLASPLRRDLRAEMRDRLRGQRLACHCKARSLPCHAEVVAAVANASDDFLTSMYPTTP